MLLLEINKADRTPVYLQMKRQLAEHIVERRLPKDAAMPDVGAIAAAAGVCVRTADQALLALVEDGVCYRRPKRGTFVARGAEEARRKIIGINCPYSTDRLAMHHVENAIYAGIIAAGGERGVTPSFLSGDLGDNVRFYQRSRETELSGVILLSELPDARSLSALADYAPTPFVLINYDVGAAAPGNVTCVFNDDFLGGYQAAEHLIRQGHRSFAILTFDITNNNYRHRVDGYRQAFRDHGVQFRPELLLNHGPHPLEWPDELVDLGSELLERGGAGWVEFPNLRAQMGLGAELCREAWRAGLDFTAALCVNDYLALGAAQAGRGKNLAVAGYDNIMPELSRGANFTTVAIDFQEMGVRAVNMLAGGVMPHDRVMRVMPRLITRKRKGGAP